MSSLHISCLAANKGITIKRNTTLPEFVLLIEVLCFDKAETTKVLNGQDVAIAGSALLKLRVSLEEKLKLLIPQASNSKRGVSYEILGEMIKLDAKAYEGDSNIRFLNSLMNMVDQAIKNSDCIYLLNRDRLERSDNTGVILPILRDHNGTLQVKELLSIINDNRKKVEGVGEQLDIEQFQLAIDHFQSLSLVKRNNNEVTITLKGRALILY